MLGIAIVAGLLFLIFGLPKILSKKPLLIQVFSNEWRAILTDYVPFYKQLDDDKKSVFEKDILRFLNNHTITGIGTEVDDISKVLIGASAIIPIFHFHDWNYPNLKEVLLFETEVEERYTYDHKHKFEVQGKVMDDSFGNGVLMLAKDDLINGFQIKTSKSNVGIHEFVHMIDKADGDVDGTPELLMNKKLITTWADLIYNKIEKIKHNESRDINSYGATSPAEFLAVVSEYFFKRPTLLKRKHPELYKVLDKVFNK